MRIATTVAGRTLVECKKYSSRLKTLVKKYLYSHISSIGEILLIDVERHSKDRILTFGYIEGKPSDMPIYQMQEAFSEWCCYKGNSRHFQFCDWLQITIKDICNNYINCLLNCDDVDFLKDLDKEIESLKSTAEFPDMEKEYSELIKSLFKYLREIYPDYAMIEHLGMDVSEYLVQIAVHQSNKLITPHSAQLDFRQMCIIRMSPIIEHIRNGKKLEEYKEKFCSLYCNIIHTVQLSDNHEIVMSDKEKKNYKEQAETWFDFFKICYDEYWEEYSVYGLELQNQIGNYREKLKPIEEIQKIYKEYLTTIQDKDEDPDLIDKKFFALCLELALKMQKQTSIFHMNQKIIKFIPGQRQAYKATKKKIQKYDFDFAEQTTYLLRGGFGYVMDLLYRLVGVLEEYHKEIFGCSLGHEDLWYRGICDETYHILPSIYRKYTETTYNVKYKPSDKQMSISLQQLQHHLLQRFKYQADGAPEIMNQAIYQDNDYLALMQHYQLPSNLLDWSEDVFAAFYFALEDYFKQKKDIKQASPAIYILDPAAYNSARKEMILDECNKCKCKSDCKVYVRRQELFIKELVPNVSVQINKNLMADYFCRDYFDEDDQCVHWRDRDKILSEERKICEMGKLPIAYYCSRLSPRIRAQSGQFVAFNLTVHPYRKVDEKKGEIKGEWSFDYMALDIIQRYYLQGKIGRHPFMLKMVLPQKECYELAGLLRKIGIKTMKYYPELTNLKE